MTLAEKLALRAKHTCMLKMSSMRCIGCNAGVPYPALTIAEIEESLAEGRRERRAAAPALRASRRPR